MLDNNQCINPFKITINDMILKETGFFKDIVIKDRNEILSAPHIPEEQLYKIKSKLIKGQKPKTINRLKINNNYQSPINPTAFLTNKGQYKCNIHPIRTVKKRNDSEVTFGYNQ